VLLVSVMLPPVTLHDTRMGFVAVSPALVSATAVKEVI